MNITRIIAALSLAGTFTSSSLAQDVAATQDMEDVDRAAATMVERIYVRQPTAHWRPSETIAKLQELGYTNIHDFDVEWGYYEVEATAPNGNEVEIEIDPVTGSIRDIEDNWF